MSVKCLFLGQPATTSPHVVVGNKRGKRIQHSHPRRKPKNADDPGTRSSAIRSCPGQERRSGRRSTYVKPPSLGQFLIVYFS
jgi:hypothetical protein